ncbi:inhibitor of apoptosis-promoting Bax1-domain-containing protein [Tuber borchii]|uniref:Inhibitor of apoptosis-promoting Bax1-domain-containing protein n=1 Tax=Tuber borchii TaxID=42251 RepID=A0A2T6ZCR0_TUBBO|nr:inhibitor of apoptosis-promoting Bax1-domain-containing protein [Tuber borchii]
MFLQTAIRPVARRALLPSSSSSAKTLTRTFTALRSPVLRQTLTPVRHHQKFPLKTQFATGKRFFTTDPAIVARPTRQQSIQKLLYAGGIFGGSLLAINLLFNNESREDSIPLYERAYLQETFTYTGLGVGMMGLAAKGLHNMGWSYKLMSMNPWVVLGGGLVTAVGTLVATRATDPDNYIQKHLLWSAFNLSNAAVLAPLFFYSPAILARAGLYTVGVIGSIAFVGATAKEDKYLYLGGPLLAGVAVVALSSLGPMVLPLGSRALVASEAISLYGGLAVFGGLTLYDVQKIMHNARLADKGLIKKDTVNESISLELDFINIFIRIVQILGQQQQNRR